MLATGPTFPSTTCAGCGGQQLDPGALYCEYCIHERALWRLQERIAESDASRWDM